MALTSSHFPNTIYKVSVDFTSLPIACLYWIWLLFFFWYLFYCTSILSPSGTRTSKKVPIKTNSTSTLLIPLLLRPCLDCFFLICQWKYLPWREKEEWAYIALQSLCMLEVRRLQQWQRRRLESHQLTSNSFKSLIKISPWGGLAVQVMMDLAEKNTQQIIKRLNC